LASGEPVAIIGDSQVKLDQAARTAKTMGKSVDQAQRKAWADDRVAAVERQLQASFKQVADTQDAGLLGMLWSMAVQTPGTGLSLFTDYDPAAKARSTALHLANLGKELETWKRIKRAWAEAGKDDTGYPYPWAEWERVGNAISDSIKGQTGIFARYSIVGNFTGTIADSVAEVKKEIKQAVEDVGEALDSPWLTVALWGGGLVVGGLAVGYVVRAFK
jgi:hypothetical protein